MCGGNQDNLNKTGVLLRMYQKQPSPLRPSLKRCPGGWSWNEGRPGTSFLSLLIQIQQHKTGQITLKFIAIIPFDKFLQIIFLFLFYVINWSRAADKGSSEYISK